MSEWLFGTVREIKNMPRGVSAAVARDTDDDIALCISDNQNRFGFHFNVNYLDFTEDQIDYLARVIGTNLQITYENGRNNKKEEVMDQLKGLKELLNEIEK